MKRWLPKTIHFQQEKPIQNQNVNEKKYSMNIPKLSPARQFVIWRNSCNILCLGVLVSSFKKCKPIDFQLKKELKWSAKTFRSAEID